VTGSIAGFLLHRFPDLAAAGRSPLEAGLVHRLDTGTSGVLLAARSRDAWANLRRQFVRRQVEKEYLALVHGRLTGERELWHTLAHDRQNRAQMTVTARGGLRSRRAPSRSWTAHARVAAVESAGGTTLLAVTLFTGVTHQIRAQLAAIGHPLVGDTAYGAPAAREPAMHRPLLHAASLSFDHPQDAGRRTLSSALPQDFAHVLARLGMKTPPPRHQARGGTRNR
jgi:23S rRNA pseudouridine1911/1915/1917 synthase